MPDKYPGPDLKIHDVQCESWIDGRGVFYVKLTGEGTTETYAYTMDEAKAKMTKIILARRAKLDVKFTEITERGVIRNGTVTGLHAGNGNPLVSWEGGEKSQLTSTNGLFPRLSAADAGKQVELLKAKNDAQRAYDVHRNELRGGEAGKVYSRDTWSLDGAIKKALEGGDQE